MFGQKPILEGFGTDAFDFLQYRRFSIFQAVDTRGAILADQAQAFQFFKQGWMFCDPVQCLLMGLFI